MRTRTSPKPTAPGKALNKPRRPRRRRPPRDWREMFLEAYREVWTIAAAARQVGLRRARIYDERNRNPAFAAELIEVREEATDLIEAEARRRAVEGVDEPVMQGGRIVGYRRRYSDRLLLALMAAWRPEKYGRAPLVHRDRHTLTAAAAAICGPDDVELSGEAMAVLEELLQGAAVQ